MASRPTQYRAVAPARIEQRCIERHLVEVTRATVRRHGKKPIAARLHDISIYGCRVLSDLDTKADDRLWLRFPGGVPVAATVIWSEHGFTGCRFDEPIDRVLVRKLALPDY